MISDKTAYAIMNGGADSEFLKSLTRDEARQVLRLLQPGRCKGNPYRLIKRRLNHPRRGVTANMQQLRDRVERWQL